MANNPNNLEETKDLEDLELNTKKVILEIENTAYLINNIKMSCLKYSEYFQTMHETDKQTNFFIANENKIVNINNYFIACAFSYYIHWINNIPDLYDADFPVIFLPILDNTDISYKQTLLEYGREEQEINFYLSIPTHLLPIILNIEHKYSSINTKCPSLPDKFKIKNTDKYMFGELSLMIASRIQNIMKSEDAEEKLDIKFFPSLDFILHKIERNNIFKPIELCFECYKKEKIIEADKIHEHI
jgi:hypothetical protein